MNGCMRQDDIWKGDFHDGFAQNQAGFGWLRWSIYEMNDQRMVGWLDGWMDWVDSSRVEQLDTRFLRWNECTGCLFCFFASFCCASAMQVEVFGVRYVRVSQDL